MDNGRGRGRRSSHTTSSSGRAPRSRSRALLLAVVATGSLAACSSNAVVDAGSRPDAREPFLVDPVDASTTTPADAGDGTVGRIDVRLANMLVAGPNLTVCFSTIPSTGASETAGRILGSPDASTGSDGTLPYPGVSPYLSLPVYASVGLTYVFRLFDRDDVPFSLGGACPTDGSVTPVVEGRLVPSELGIPEGGVATLTAAAIGVVDGAPVTCAGTCPEPSLAVFPDATEASSDHARVRLVHAIPNLPAPVHVCFDADFVSVAEPGDLPQARVLPTIADTDGLAFGEQTATIDVPPLSGTPGAFFVHATIGALPDCASATTLLGPITLPFAVPDTAPATVARTLDAGDVVTLFAYGRAGDACTDAASCVVPGAVCSSTAHVCVDALSPGVLPWLDVAGE